jgi:hypothetical protein
MSKFLSSVASKEFDSDVKQAYQTSGLLRECVTRRNGVIGDTYNFRKIGKGLANQKSTSDLVTPMDVGHELIPAVLSNWNAPEYTDIFDQKDVNFDEKIELAKAIAGALGRREDQLCIDAMEASTPTAGPIVDAGVNLTLAKIVEAAATLTDQGVPTSDRYMAISASALEAVLKDETITNNDYNTVRLLMAGTIDTFMGFKWKIIESRAEGGLAITGNIRSCWAWHREAVGTAVGMDISTRVDWVAERTAWLCNGMLKAGSVVRDVDGLIRVDIDESA